MMEVTEWKRGIEIDRENKDDFFKRHLQSPIPPEEREQFRGLNYYPPSPDYRFELELQEHKQKNVVKIEDTQGNERQFMKWGEFKFKIGDSDCELQAYKSDPTEERLFVPFRDTTSGKQTYGAGRYLDLAAGEHQTPEGKWILDFNMAYNPWCAYSQFYACPFVPRENWLEVAVHAGEKNYVSKQE
jgi:uncharacterized protein (DUF1684 family)